jgi:hypothetical protein
MLFRSGSETRHDPGPEVEVSLELMDEGYKNFDIGFTRGYLSSQAYVDRFDNAAFQPQNPTIDFSTTPYERRWNWLGFHARRLIFDFLAEAMEDPGLSLDVFAYDLDEPDFIGGLRELGGPLRLFLDDSRDYVKTGAPEVEARGVLEASAGQANVKTQRQARRIALSMALDRVELGAALATGHPAAAAGVPGDSRGGGY